MYQRKLRQVCSVLPPQLAAMVSQLPPEQEEQLEELRLRCGSEITMVCGGREQPLSLTRPMLCTRDLLEHLVNLASSYSTYAVEECLRQGYLPLEGGHRLGLCGTAVVQDGRIATIKDISSVNLRVAGQHLGCATALLDALGPNPGNVLLVGPPGSGKTTLLRDLVRQLSDRLDQRVGRGGQSRRDCGDGPGPAADADRPPDRCADWCAQGSRDGIAGAHHEPPLGGRG